MLPLRSALALSALLFLPGCAPSPVVPPAVTPASSAARATAPSPSAPPPDPLAAKIDPLFADYAQPTSPGCAVAVYRAGEIAFARGYGLASLEHSVPISADTIFDIGSVSKQFTALALLLLVQDGKVSLDDDIRRYVPEVPVYGKPITLRHLLHHTSGLRDYAGLLGINGFDAADFTNDDDGLWAIAHQKALNFPTGTQWSYSNTGYFLLSIVVKRVSGETLARFAKARIFDPLGMTHTIYMDDHKLVIPHRATGYESRKDGGFGVAMSDYEQTGDGAVQTSVADVAKWDANFYAPKVGTAATIALLRTPGKLDDGKPLTYAMGLEEIVGSGGVRSEEHNGAWAGYRADILRLPDERLTVACLCNLADADPSERADAVAAALVPKLAEAAEPAQQEALPTPASVTPADFAPALGTYYDPDTFEVRKLSLDDGEIFLDFQLAPGGYRRKLAARDARTFVVLGVPAASATTYRFEPAAGKLPARIVRTPNDGNPTTLERFEPVTPTPAALAPYVGRYTSDEVLRDADIEVVDGKLVFGEWGRTLGPVPMKPLGADTFTFGGVGFRFARDKRGNVSGFTMSADRLVGIRWTKREAGRGKGATR